MTDREERIHKSNLLIVEGPGDLAFWNAVLKHHARDDTQVMKTDGNIGLGPKVRAISIAPNFNMVRWIGAIQDADNDPKAAFDRIPGAFAQAGLPAPRRTWEVSPTSPAVAAIVLPDGQSPGDLETLVLQALDQEPAMACVTAYLSCLQQAGINPARQQSKARMYAFLASLDPPFHSLGHAAARGLLPLPSPVFTRLLDLLPSP